MTTNFTPTLDNSKYSGWANYSQQFLNAYGADSANVGFFIKNELDFNLKEVFKPLYGYTYDRDIEQVQGGGLGTQTTSIIRADYRGVGGVSPTSINVTPNGSTSIPAIEVNNTREAFPVLKWESTMVWTDRALEESAQVGRPITAQQQEALQMKYKMARDQYAYLGLIDYKNPTLAAGMKPYGLLNAPFAYTAPAMQSTFWTMLQQDSNNASAQQAIIDALSSVQGQVWFNSGQAVIPNCLLLPPEVYAILASVVVSQAGNMSLLQYLETNNIYTRNVGKPIEIHAVKWLSNQLPNEASLGATSSAVTKAPVTQAEQKASNSPDWFNNGGLMRAVWYSKGERHACIPTFDLKSMPTYPVGTTWETSVWTLLAHIFLPYPQTIGYLDGV